MKLKTLKVNVVWLFISNNPPKQDWGWKRSASYLEGDHYMYDYEQAVLINHF